MRNIPKKMHLFVNKKCNMNCKYCYWPSHPNEEMTEGVADRVIAYIKGNPDKYDYIVFFGGEPMLSPHILLKFIRTIGYEMKYIVMTNGTISPKKLLDELYRSSERRYDLCFTVSYEGFSQAARMRGTNRLIEKNIRLIRRYVPTVRVSIASVLSPYNYRDILRNIVYFYTLADTGLFIRICDLPHIWRSEELKAHIADFPRIVDLLTYYEVVKEKTVLLSNRVDRKIEDEGDNVNGSKGHFCQNSLKYMDVVGTDGKKYLCEPAFASDERCYGDLWENNPSEALAYNKRYPGVHHHHCLYYRSQDLNYDRAMDRMRIKYQERKQRFRRLKEAKKQNLLSDDKQGRLWRLANDNYRK